MERAPAGVPQRNSRGMRSGLTQTGVISRMGARGFGFIQPTDESPAVFFNLKECGARNQVLNVGDRVEFELNAFAARRGDRRACEVRVIHAAR